MVNQGPGTPDQYRNVSNSDSESVATGDCKEIGIGGFMIFLCLPVPNVGLLRLYCGFIKGTRVIKAQV